VNSLLVTDTFLPRIGGRENYYHALFTHLEGENVKIATPDLMGNWQEFDRAYPLPILRIPDLSQKWFKWGRPGRWKWWKILAEIHVKSPLDCVHCGVVLPDGMTGWLLWQTLGIPYIVYTHGKEVLENQRDSEKNLLMNLVFSQAARVVSNSNYTGELVKACGVAPEKVVRITPGIDVRQWRNVPEGGHLQALRARYDLENRPVILSVGRLLERKGIDRTIAALPRVLAKFPETVYLVVGDGPDRDRLERQVEELNLGQSVRFTGAMSDADLQAAYHLGTVFAMVSRQPQGSHEVEGFGIVYLEANICGLPVVAGRSGGVPDAVVDGKTGYLVDPEDPEAIAAAIVRLLENRPLREQMGEFGRERAIAEFDWSRCAVKLQILMARVREEHPGRSLPSQVWQTVPFLLRRRIVDDRM